jgi:hypothetical protein
VLVLVELGVTDPVLVLDAPALSDLLQQCFWGCAHAGDESVRGLERLSFTGAPSDHLNDQSAAMPLHFDEIWIILGPQVPGDVTAMADLVNRCHERDLALAKQLTGDLPVEGFLVGLDRQEEVGPLLREPLKNGFCVWRASA